MKKLVVFALALIALVPTASAQTAGSFTGKWEGTFVRQMPDGSQGNPQTVLFDLTQKGKVLTGTAGPNDQQQWKIDKGAVAAGKGTFEVQQPNGPVFKFTLSVVKGRLQGDASVEADGVVRGKVTVDAGKAKPVK